jgi:Protein of unknown function (DUF1552)
MKLDFNRRQVLRFMGTQLALPLLSTVFPGEAAAAGNVRKRFIGAYVPNGAYMPNGIDGNWNWTEALEPLVTQGHKPNTMILRGLFNGHGNDPHWENTASFLSARPIQLGDPGVAICGKTVDQYVAEANVAPLRSLEIGGLYYHVHLLTDHPGYSNDYLNRVSWQAPNKFRSPIPDPIRVFEKLFTVDTQGAAALKYLHSRKKSVLDAMQKDATRLKTRLPSEYHPVLSSYLETVREVELQMNAGNGTACTPTFAKPADTFGTRDSNYVTRFQSMHQMIVMAMQCGLVNASTIMYGPAVSDFMVYSDIIGAGAAHHSVAHNMGNASSIDRLKQINKIQTGLLADLLTKLKAANLLQDTLVMYGSDMSDGNLHLPDNLPMLLCGAGADLKWGQEIGNAATKRPLSDLHLEILNLTGVPGITSFGEGKCLSTGPLPIRV